MRPILESWTLEVNNKSQNLRAAGGPAEAKTVRGKRAKAREDHSGPLAPVANLLWIGSVAAMFDQVVQRAAPTANQRTSARASLTACNRADSCANRGRSRYSEDHVTGRVVLTGRLISYTRDPGSWRGASTRCVASSRYGSR